MQLARLRHTGPVLLLLAAQFCAAQLNYTVTMLEGSAKVQRSGKRNWEKLSLNDEINDNDIVETFFQAKLILRHGEKNFLILGSNSKVLLNLAPRQEGGGVSANATVFAGGVFVKAVANYHAGIYTSSAIAQSDSGVFSAVVDGRTGHTGFQCIGGSAEVRNIAEQESRPLAAGQTSVIAPGKQPTAPLHITHKHVSVLKHFFGFEYIQRELEASNITPTDDAAPNRLTLSRELEARSDQNLLDQRYKPLFNYNLIYGKILEDQQSSGRRYRCMTRPVSPFKNRIDVGVGGRMAYVNNATFPVVEIYPALHLRHLRLGLRLAGVWDYRDEIHLNTTGFAGIADKLGYLSVGSFSDSIFITAGPIRNYTIGSGIVVDRFSNSNPYSMLNTIGVVGQLKKYPINLNAFVADITSFRVGGVQFCAEPSLYRFAAGYYFDLDQYRRHDGDSYPRFVEIPARPANPDPDSVEANAHIYDINAGVDVINNYRLRLHGLIHWAQKIRSGGTDGFVLKGPGAVIEASWLRIGGGLNVEWGRMISGEFNRFYMTNRSRVLDGDTIITQNNLLSDRRRAYGLFADLGASPFRGTSVSIKGTYDVITRNAFADTTLDTTRGGFTYYASFAIDSNLIRPIRFAQIHASQIYGGYYPPGSGFYWSWGFEAGFDFLTAPIVFGIALEGGVTFQLLDLDNNSAPSARFDNAVGSDDRVIEGYLGIRRGFL